MDEGGRPLEFYSFHPGTDSPDAAARFSSLVLVNHRKHRACEIFGLMRSSAVRQTPLQGAYARGDSVFLARLALIGKFVELPDRLFLSRSHTSQSMQTLPQQSQNGRSRLTRLLGTGPLPPPEWWDASRKGKANFPEWNLIKQYSLCVAQSPLGAGQKLRCGLALIGWLLRNPHKLMRDVIFAVETVSRQISQHDDEQSDAQALPR